MREAHNADELGARFEQMAGTTPAAAAQCIVRGIERNQRRVLIGRDARLLDVIQRLLPASYWSVLARAFDRMTV